MHEEKREMFQACIRFTWLTTKDDPQAEKPTSSSVLRATKEERKETKQNKRIKKQKVSLPL